MNAKLRKPSLIKYCNNCFSPTHIKFNFSFITYEDNFDEKYQIQLLKRIREMSSVPFIELMSWSKNKGFEIEKINIEKNISPNFYQGHRDFDDEKYAIFRLYTNDNPILARVIGRLINKIFYIFFIDIGGNLYNHSKK